ncbi:VUT family protein [Phreatobacter sp.]|uniref:VUT family protein n=1 Tax=Phreatobacter sp. TaxID=1966341 RepID=UPI0025E13658|nr:VUT family protein [Phreatobacter sp.]
MLGYLALPAFIATIPAANWLIGNVGTVCVPNGPCLIPVGFGLMAPSGVLMIGLALVLRDLVQRRLGLLWSLGGIVAGAALSWTVASPALALASAAAFLFSELADTAIYTPLARKRLIAAVWASSLVGTVIDSTLFLWLAFGSVSLLPGLVLGKVWMVAAATAVLWFMRRRDPAAFAAR